MRIFYETSESEQSKNAYKELSAIHPPCEKHDADVIVVIGGDGFMLRCLHAYTNKNVKLYGLNYGTVGFMMNTISNNVITAIQNAHEHTLYPLEADAVLGDGSTCTLYGYNEVSLHRLTQQAIHLQIDIQEKKRMDKLVCDGALVATPIGSTAYNLSAHGAVLPIGSHALALTPISPFHPRRWRGAILPDTAQITFTCLDTKKRPVALATDNRSIDNITSVRIRKASCRHVCILTDSHHDLEERIMLEQFQ